MYKTDGQTNYVLELLQSYEQELYAKDINFAKAFQKTRLEIEENALSGSIKILNGRRVDMFDFVLLVEHYDFKSHDRHHVRLVQILYIRLDMNKEKTESEVFAFPPEPRYFKPRHVHKKFEQIMDWQSFIKIRPD